MSWSNGGIVVQEVWIAVFRGLPRLRDADRFIPWMFTIARRSVNDRLRSVYLRVPEVPTRDEESHVEIEDPLAGIPDQMLIQSALSELAPIDREVTWLAHFEDRSVADIAEITDVPVGTVKSRLHRSRRQLRSILESTGYRP